MKYRKEPENAGDIEMKDLNKENDDNILEKVGSDSKTPFLEKEAPPPSDN